VDPELCRKVVDGCPRPVGRHQLRYLCRRQAALPSPWSGFSSYWWSDAAIALFQHNVMKLCDSRTDFLV
jgi:hypothetical protein